MDLETFDRCCRQARLLPHQKLMAEAYLFKRGSMRQIGRVYGRSQVTVMRCVHRVRRAYRVLYGLPQSLPVITIVARPEHVTALRGYELDVLEGRGSELPPRLNARPRRRVKATR